MDIEVFHDRCGRIKPLPQNPVFRKRQGIFAVIYNDRSEILVTWQAHAKDVPEFPGGGIDGEQQKDAALLREIAEETGLALPFLPKIEHEFTQTIGFYADISDEFWIYDQTFWLLNHNKTPETECSPEGGIVRWVSKRDMDELPLCYQHRLCWKHFRQFML